MAKELEKVLDMRPAASILLASRFVFWAKSSNAGLLAVAPGHVYWVNPLICRGIPSAIGALGTFHATAEVLSRSELLGQDDCDPDVRSVFSAGVLEPDHKCFSRKEFIRRIGLDQTSCQGGKRGHFAL